MKYNKAIDSYISYCLGPCDVKEFTDSIFWIKKGNVIVEIEKSNIFWLHVDIWESISRMFELDYAETQSVIRIWLEQHYDLGELTSDRVFSCFSSVLEQHYDLGELTPNASQKVWRRRWNNILIWGN